jgi:hypothetical protein
MSVLLDSPPLAEFRLRSQLSQDSAAMSVLPGKGEDNTDQV